MDRGQSLIITSLFDGTNYAYWKVRMRVFLQSLDEKVWQVVEIGWTKPGKRRPIGMKQKSRRQTSTTEH